MSCTIVGCVNRLYSKGFCKVHYDKNRRHGNPNFEQELDKLKPCLVEDCSKLRFANSYCPKHNRRFQRHGDPNYVNPKCNRDGNTKVRRAQYYRGWLTDNWPSQKAYRMARKKRVKQATPPGTDLKAIETLYRECPRGHEVDHIIPLINDNVCGLNVPCNLQYLTEYENMSKNNKFDGTYENLSWKKQKTLKKAV